MNIYDIGTYATEAAAIRREFLEHEEEIIQQIAAGDKSVRYRLIEGNLLLVVKIAYDFLGRGMSLHELISEGNQALMNCAEIFDVSIGTKFSSYVGMAVRRRICVHLLTRNTLLRRTSTCGIQRAMRVLRWARDFEVIHGKVPTTEEISKNFPTLSEKQIKNYMLSVVDRINNTGEEWDLIETVAVCTPEVSESFRKEELSTYLENLMHEELDPRTLKIVKMRTGIGIEAPMTLDEVAQVFGLTRERIRQIYFTGLKKLGRKIDPGIIGHLEYKQEIEENGHGISHRSG